MPKPAQSVRRDREITRAIHRLFWRGNFANRGTFLIWLCMRPPALFIYNVLIPIQVAYGLQAIIQQRFGAVQHYAIAIVMLALAYCVLWAAGGRAICKNGAVGGAYVQKTVFTNFLQKDYEFYNTTYLGTLSAQAVRLREAFNEYNQIMINAIPAQAIVVVSSIAIIAYYSLVLAAVALVCMLLVLSFTVASSRWRLRYRRVLGEANGMLAGIIGDALGQGTTVKSFAAEAYEERRLDTAVNKWSAAQYHSWLSSIPSDVGRMALAAITTGALLLLTAHLYQRHAISIAIVALVQLYVVKLISTTQDIADTIKSYETMIGGAYQSIKIMMVQPTILDAVQPKQLPKHMKRSITFGGVKFRYSEARSHVNAVDDFNLAIAPGEKIGLVGYSGSGKTTLTKLLVRFMDVTKGSITIDGVDIRDIAQSDLRRCIAYVPQEPLLFHRSISENIGYGRPEASKEAVLQAAQQPTWMNS